MMIRTMGIAAALTLTSFLGITPPALAQSVAVERGARTEGATPGWIGISFDVMTDRLGSIREIVVTDVRVGSPAQHAGIQAGDLILAINDLNDPRELAELGARLHLEAGDDVVMEFRRSGRTREVRMEAAARPAAFVVRTAVQRAIEADSMVQTWVRAMDSLRVELISERNGRIQVRRIQSDSGDGIAVVTDGGGEIVTSTRAVRPPFEFFVFRGESHDSLRQEMAEVNRMAIELEEMLAQRERQLRRQIGSSSTLDLDRDYEFRQITDALSQIADRSSELQEAMAEAARQTAGFDYLRETPPAPKASTVVRESTQASEFRPLTPYLLGRNRVAGAEVIDLKPELAQYFGVGRGVLVVDVAPGTPASMAGIVPGDVITRVDQVGVLSVEDLRFGVSMAGDSLPISLVRQGTSVQLLLPR